MDNPEKLSTWGTQDEANQNKNIIPLPNMLYLYKIPYDHDHDVPYLQV